MIMVDCKRFWFLLPKKGRTEMDNGCKINFIVLILQSHDCRNWVDLASNFLHYLSNLFKKVFWSSNTRFFSSDKKKGFDVQQFLLLLFIQPQNMHLQLLSWQITNIGYHCKSIPKSDFYHTSMQSSPVSLSFSYIHINKAWNNISMF